MTHWTYVKTSHCYILSHFPLYIASHEGSMTPLLLYSLRSQHFGIKLDLSGVETGTNGGEIVDVFTMELGLRPCLHDTVGQGVSLDVISKGRHLPEGGLGSSREAP